MMVIILVQEAIVRQVLGMIKQSTFGIRNQIFAPSLWFLPCLFVVTILYHTVYSIFIKYKYKSYLVLAISIMIYVSTVLPNNPIVRPNWVFNVDSALYYIIYWQSVQCIFNY